MRTELLFATLIPLIVAQTGQPKFDPELETVVLQDGSFTKIECTAVGELPLIYTWYNQSDVEITSDSNRPVFSRRTSDGCSLIFDVVEPSHSGLYTCTARNKHGSASKIYEIIVNTTSGKKNETASIKSVNVSKVTENSVEFIVETSGDPEVFYVIYREVANKTERSAEIRKGEAVEIKNLIPSGRYNFQFQIEPPWKIKRDSRNYTVILFPGVPDVIFRTLKDGILDIEWFQNVHDVIRKTIDEYDLYYTNVQMSRGQEFVNGSCTVSIKILPQSCYTTRYTIAGLSLNSYYEISLRAHTSAGYGKYYRNKIRIV